MYKDVHKRLIKATMRYLTVLYTTKDPATAGRERGECFVAGYSEQTKGPGKRGHIVSDTLLSMMFLGLPKLGNICCRHKMFLKKSETFFVSRTQNLCPQQMLRAQANWETFVSATMCPQQCVLVRQGLKLKHMARKNRENHYGNACA